MDRRRPTPVRGKGKKVSRVKRRDCGEGADNRIFRGYAPP